MTERIQGKCGETRARMFGPKIVLELVRFVIAWFTPTWTQVLWKSITDGPPESPGQRDWKMPLVQIWMEGRVQGVSCGGRV